MNERGEGPYEAQRRPSMPWSGHRQPSPQYDFSVFSDGDMKWSARPEHERAVKDLLKPYYFAFPHMKAAKQWFGTEGLEKLAKQGFPLVEVEADWMLVSDSEFQCIFIPTRPLDSYAETVRELHAQALDRMEHVYPQPEPKPFEPFVIKEPIAFPDIMDDIVSVQPMSYIPLTFVTSDALTISDVQWSFDAMKAADNITIVKRRDTAGEPVALRLDYPTPTL